MVELEKDLVSDCLEAARAMGAFLEVVGQRRAKGSGTSIGFPDAVLSCSGRVCLIEFKRPGGRLSAGQVGARARRLEQGVPTYVVDSLDLFVSIVNACRRDRAGVSTRPAE